MTNLELVLNMLAEVSTTEISKEKQPKTFLESKKIEENPRKLYIAYKVGRSFAEVKLQRSDIKIWIGEGIDDPKGMIRDVSNIGHHGIGNSEITLKSFDELDYVVGLIEQSYLQSI